MMESPTHPQSSSADAFAAMPREFFAGYFDAFPHMILVTLTSNGRVVYANPKALQVLKDNGKAEVIGKSTIDLDYWPDEAARLEHVRQARQPGGVIRRIRVNGDDEVDLLSSSCVWSEGVEYLVSSVVDISNILDIENQLTDALERLEKAQALGRIGDFVADLSLENFNGSAEAMRILGFGNNPQSITSKELFSRFAPEDRRWIATAVAEQLPNGSFEVEHKLVLPRQTERWIYTRASVETSKKGKEFVRGTILDITERKRQEHERQRFQEQFQEAQRLESLGLLSGGIAHDFNNLLTGVLGNAEFALLEPDLPERVRSRLNDVVTAANRAADLTRQLLAYAGKAQFVIEPVNMSNLIREMTDLLSITIGKDKELDLVLEDELPAAEVDATQIRQVVMNIIINASEAIQHPNGKITLHTSLRAIDPVDANQMDSSGELQAGDYICLEISDNGCGMDEQTLAKLFDPFFTTKFTGRGLGMAAALGIVRGHAGFIQVESTLGSGSRFTVLLPASNAAVEAGEPTEGFHPDWVGSASVLIIDDDVSPRNFARSVLESFGYQVFTARDGREGLNTYQANQEVIALVLLDLTMPVMDGRETYAALRKLNPDVKALLMSGYDEQDAIKEFMGSGLAGFLPKPFSVKSLMDAVVEAGVREGSIT